MQKEKRIKTINSIFWRFFERCGAQGVTFAVTIILARILEPSVYGDIAVITVFTNILQVFVDSGLGSALIQKKDSDDEDFSTVFCFNIIICLILYTLLFWMAPKIVNFYRLSHLTSVIRISGLVIIISGVKNIQQAYVSKHMLFKRFFFSTLGGTVSAAFIGIILALKGYGIWALVFQNLFNQLIDTIILWITVRWRLTKVFSFEKLRGLFSYSWKLLAAVLLDTFYNELRQLIIGKKYTTSDLAFYNQGQKIPALIVSNINTSIDSVLLPSLSEEQEHADRIKAMVRRAIKVSTFIMMPLLTGLLVCAESLVLLVLGEKWLLCVPYIRIFCISYCFYVVHTANLNAIKALGKSNIILRLEITKKIVGLTILFVSMRFGVMAMATSGLIECLLGQIINSWPNKKLLQYKYIDQVRDMVPQMVLSVTMGIIIYSISFVKMPMFFGLIIQIVLGIFVYIIGAKWFQIDSYKYICSIIKDYLKKES